VPSGGAFKVKTRIYLSWGENNTTNIYVVTAIVWTGSSWLKSSITSNTYSGQKEALGILISELKKWISSTGPGTLKASPKKGKGKAVKKERDEQETEESANMKADENTEDTTITSSTNEDKSYMNILIEQFDLKLVLLLILFIVVITDKFKTHKESRGYELYTSDRMLMSESSLWDWIGKREHSALTQQNMQHNGAEAFKHHPVKLRNSATGRSNNRKHDKKRHISGQDLVDTIAMIEEQLAELKKLAPQSTEIL